MHLQPGRSWLITSGGQIWISSWIPSSPEGFLLLPTMVSVHDNLSRLCLPTAPPAVSGSKDNGCHPDELRGAVCVSDEGSSWLWRAGMYPWPLTGWGPEGQITAAPDGRLTRLSLGFSNLAPTSPVKTSATYLFSLPIPERQPTSLLLHFLFPWTRWTTAAVMAKHLKEPLLAGPAKHAPPSLKFSSPCQNQVSSRTTTASNQGEP